MARRKKKKREADSGPAGAPEWVVTFTDMISLLVTFFVLLMTFSSLDAYDALKIDAWLSGQKGVHESTGTVMPDLPQEDLVAFSSVERGSIQPHTRPPDKLPESMEEMGQKQREGDVAIDLSEVRDGLVIDFDEDCCFGPGSAAISEPLRERLRELGEVLENYPHLVVVEGFTDAAFTSSVRYGSPEELSLARALAAANVLLAESGMNPQLMQVAALGAASPRADNESAGGRRLNRRIQVRVLSLSKLRATYLEAQKGSED